MGGYKMQGPRGTRTEEIQNVIHLIDQVFRIDRGLPPSMGEQFPLLLREENKDRMRIIVDQNQPVAAVNYYKSHLLIQGTKIPVASVGSVCTHPDYQGKGIATALLDDVEEKMRQEDILLMLVSGRRNMYRRRHCSISGDFYKATFFPKAKKAEVELIPYSPEYLDDIRRLYYAEGLRYERDYEEFIGFFQGGTRDWGKLTYQVCLMKEKGEVSGYFVLGISKEIDHRWGKIREYAGDRDQIVAGCYEVLDQHDLSFITLHFSTGDPIKYAMMRQKVQMEKENQVGTLKILQFTKLMDQLRSYFSKYVPKTLLDRLIYGEEGERYFLGVGDDKIWFKNLDEVNQFIFGVNYQEPIPTYKWDFKEQPLLQEFYQTVFPIPIPWAECLNYI